MDDTLLKKIQQLERENAYFRGEFRKISESIDSIATRLNQLGTAQNALAILVDEQAENKSPLIKLN